MKLPIRFLRINDTIIWSAPVELFCEIAIHVRNASPFTHTLYFGYTNGVVRLLPDGAGHRRRRLRAQHLAFYRSGGKRYNGESDYLSARRKVTLSSRGADHRFLWSDSRLLAGRQQPPVSLVCLALAAVLTAATNQEVTFIGARVKYWAYQTVSRAGRSANPRPMGADSDRRVHSASSPTKTPRPLAAPRPYSTHPPRHFRSHRTPSHARRSRGLLARHLTRCLRQSSGPPDRVPALRRTLGLQVARCRALRRHQWLRA